MFVVELYSRKIFSYVFFVRKYFRNEIKANYGTRYPHREDIMIIRQKMPLAKSGLVDSRQLRGCGGDEWRGCMIAV